MVRRLTTEADFNVSSVIDLGEPCVVSLKVRLTEFEDDGETIGQGAGEIFVNWVVEQSPDGVTFSAGAAAAPLEELGDAAHVAFACGRYLRLGAAVNDDGGLYAGANDPWASVDFEMSRSD